MVARRIPELNDPMWVVGTIDAYGEIRARVGKSGDSPMHTIEDRHKCCFRWNIWNQDFCDVDIRCGRLDKDDNMLVRDWLEREGYKEPYE